MWKLEFFDNTHTYLLNGEEVPSVSEISRFASREVYNDNIDKFVLDNARDRGKAVHIATEELDTKGTCDIVNEYINYINAYISFRKDYNISEYVYIEKAFASETMLFAGTIDRAIVIDEHLTEIVKKQCKVDISNKIGQLAILDFKTSSAVQKALAQIQLPAYSILIEENTKYKVGALFILHLKKDGKYKLHYFENDDYLLQSCLNLHKALAKKKRSKKWN